MAQSSFTVDISGREHLEAWRSIPGYEGCYEASNLGRIRSVDRISVDSRKTRSLKGRVLKQRLINSGYIVVMLPRRFGGPNLVHRLVLAAFGGEAPDGFVCCHNNGIKTDNRIENLRWDSYSENNYDILRHHGPRSHCRRGHPFNEANTHITRKGERFCRACARVRHHARKAPQTG